MELDTIAEHLHDLSTKQAVMIAQHDHLDQCVDQLRQQITTLRQWIMGLAATVIAAAVVMLVTSGAAG